MSASDQTPAVQVVVRAIGASLISMENARKIVAALDAGGWLRDPAESADALSREGLTYREIGDRLGVTPREARRLALQAREGSS